MEFRETLLAAQRNQQQKSSESSYYKARFDPPKKEQRQKDRLSANIQKFLAKKDEEEKQKKLEAQKKREELIAMRDPKALRKIQKTLKVIKSANKSVIADAVDRDNTAVTLIGSEQPDQDDYGYESQEAAALYAKMMQKYSKIPEEPKFPVASKTVKKDLNGTIERVKHALQHEDDPVPHKRRRRTEAGIRKLSAGERLADLCDRDESPPSKYEPEKKEEKKEKPKIRKPMPPPMDFNQLLKLAEQKKAEPLEVALKKPLAEAKGEPERLMTKKQKREYEEEMERRRRRQERLDAEKSGKRIQKEERPERPVERERKPETVGFGRIPKIGDKANGRHDSPKSNDRDRDRERVEKMHREKERARAKEASERDKAEREKERIDKERLEKLKAERDRIDREMERLAKEKEKLDKPKPRIDTKSVDRSKLVDRSKFSDREPVRQDVKKNIDLKSQNTYRIDKNSNEKRVAVATKSDNRINGQTSQGKPLPRPMSEKDRALAKKLDGSPKLNGLARPENGKRLPDKVLGKRPDDRRPGAPPAGPSKPGKMSNSFDFDKHVSGLKNGRQFSPGDVKRKPKPDAPRGKRRLDSESDYDSEMDDFIDDGDVEEDYSKHIKEIFGYDKSKYRYMDDDDDPSMESSFVQQQREEYISKKHGIMEDLEDMRLEAMMKAKKGKKKRRISDD